MAGAASAVLLAFGILILSALLASAIGVPNPDIDPTCVGGWNRQGVYYPRELGGCCTGTECCQYPAFNDSPACIVSPMPSCSGTECCKYEQYKNTPLCVVSPTPTPTPTPDNKSKSCTGIECCAYEEYKDTPLCVATSMPDCTGTECCQYEEYKDTALCIVPPTPIEDECTAPPPGCSVGTGIGTSPPRLLDPALVSGSKCRGACGPDCPDTCVKVQNQVHCIADSKGECFYTCTYYNAVSCGTHQGCRVHDDCYDACAAKGEERMCWALGFCHCACDAGCLWNYGPVNCYQWMGGGGPVDYSVLYSSPPLRSGPFKACPPGSIPPGA